MAEYYDVTVITAQYHKQDITAGCLRLDSKVRKHLRFLYVRHRWWHYKPGKFWSWVEVSFGKPLMNIAYQDWLRCACGTAKSELLLKRYDVMHLLTYVGWRFPGKFYRLDIPFVWGPIGGLINMPLNNFPLLGLRGSCYYAARNVINSMQIRLLQGPRRALQKAGKAVIAATSEIQEALIRHFHVPSTVICEVGMPDTSSSERTARNTGEVLRICWSGLHVQRKALHLLLQSLPKVESSVDYEVHILGDGPARPRWQRLANKLKVNSKCQWYGQVPRSLALGVMQSCHLLIITSLKDLTSSVAVEALSLGLPVVCLEHCGFADLVDVTCGFKIPVTSLDQITSGLASAITKLYHDEALRGRMADGAIERSKAYLWSSKMTSLDAVYEAALSAR